MSDANQLGIVCTISFFPIRILNIPPPALGLARPVPPSDIDWL